MKIEYFLLTPIILCALVSIMALFLDSDQIQSPPESIIEEPNEEEIPPPPPLIDDEDNPTYDDLPFSNDGWLVYYLEPGSSVDRMLNLQYQNGREFGRVSLLELLTYSENGFENNRLNKHLEVRLRLIETEEDTILLCTEFIFQQAIDFNVALVV